MTTSHATREGRVSVPGGTIWYTVVGDAAAAPLLTVHGGPGFTHDYLEPLAALADERPVIFYDQLGSGRSDKPDDSSLWYVDRFVAELGQLVDALGYERIHLLGQSWGTIVAAEYALQRPDTLSSLIFSSPMLSVPRYAAAAAGLRATLPADIQAVLDRHEAAGTTDSAEYQDAAMTFYRHHICRLDPWPEPLLRSASQLNQTIYETMQGPSEFTITGSYKDYDITDRLPELTIPTLFLCGRFDEMRPEDTGWYASLVPGAELEVFEHSSHMPHLEEPERYLQVLRDFLQRAEAR